MRVITEEGQTGMSTSWLLSFDTLPAHESFPYLCSDHLYPHFTRTYQKKATQKEAANMTFADGMSPSQL